MTPPENSRKPEVPVFHMYIYLYMLSNVGKYKNFILFYFILLYSIINLIYLICTWYVKLFANYEINWSLNTVIWIKTFFSFAIWIFFHEHSRFTGQQGNGEGIYLTLLYHRHLDISRVIFAESSPLNIARSRTQTENFWTPSVSR